MLMMRYWLLTFFSFILTAAVIGNGYYQKQQFYPSVVYLTKSNASMAVLYLQGFVLVILMGKFMRKLFFGQLRAAEMEHLIERSWYAVTETCLAFTVFRDDFSPRFVAAFTLLLFLKSFHWLAEDRVDYMERSPVISALFHARVICLLVFLGSLDIYFMKHAYHSTIAKGASVQLVFGFEYAILATMVVMTLMKYIMHTIDLQNENPWENKAVYLLYTELTIGGVKVMLYACFMTIMIKVHTFPLFAIRPMYIAMRAFKSALHDVIMSRRAIRNMNTLYPDATTADLEQGDSVCIICREEMLIGCKKLPCNHVFHASCLRSWFQRQQTCPTCRMDVLRAPQPTPSPQPQTPPQQTQPAQPPVVPQPQPFPQFNGLPPGMPFWPPPQFLNPPVNQQLHSQANQIPNQPLLHPVSGDNTITGASPQLPPDQFTPSPMFMPMPPLAFPFDFPHPPHNLSTLTDADLTALEGHERLNVETRIQWLRDIHTLLDTAMMLVNQYNDVASTINLPNIAVSSSSQSTANTTVTPSQTGARPKTFTSIANTVSTPGSLQPSPPSNAVSPAVDADVKTIEPSEFHLSNEVDKDNVVKSGDISETIPDDSMSEVRRRRLEKFASLDKDNAV